MGWASGSSVMSAVIGGVKPQVADKEARKAIYKPIIDELEAGDWDTQDECLGEDDAYDEVMREMHPGWFEPDEE